jgi:hypothetical protein
LIQVHLIAEFISSILENTVSSTKESWISKAEVLMDHGALNLVNLMVALEWKWFDDFFKIWHI